MKKLIHLQLTIVSKIKVCCFYHTFVILISKYFHFYYTSCHFVADKKVSELTFLKISKETPQYYEILSDDTKFLLEDLQAMLMNAN